MTLWYFHTCTVLTFDESLHAISTALLKKFIVARDGAITDAQCMAVRVPLSCDHGSTSKCKVWLMQ